MSTPATRILSDTLHEVTDTDETFKVAVVHLADGKAIGYRQGVDEDGRLSLTPAEDAVVEGLVDQE